MGSTIATSIASLPQQAQLDEMRMRELIRFTARTLQTSSPVPFGALVVDTQTGATIMRAVNAVRQENDPSSHAELRAVRRATRKLGTPSLKGCTLYSTCEPCPMCMANALWAGLDRLVYGATIEDANRHCRQIRIPATELVERSDMSTIVEGPLLREACYELFTHPNMLRTFATWNATGTVSGNTTAELNSDVTRDVTSEVTIDVIANLSSTPRP